MCGIVGFFNSRGQQSIDRQLLARMNDSLHHRGPDEGDLHIEPGLGFGHRRLSVIDVSNGLQPLFNEDESVVVVFNGEIYNFQELMVELAACGHRFRTHCDTEVIVHAWEEWGAECVQRFQGMFSFVIWDRNQKTLFAARDRIGIKPFYYSMLADGTFIFGSELKALLAIPAMPRDLDPYAVEDYFAYGYVPEPRTIFQAARKLAPGHTLMLRSGDSDVRLKPYWNLPFSPVLKITENEAKEETVIRLQQAVRSHMVADVPLGAFLSGGVDSSAVVATMAGLKQGPVDTCSIGFDDPAFDESAYAKQVAEQYHTNHHTESVSANDYGLIDTLAHLYDEPYADSSAIPTYRVCALARKRVTVALSGDGGDENFAGYRRYRHAVAEDRVRSMFPGAIRKPLFSVLGSCYPKADWAPRVFRAKTTFEALARDLVDGYFHGVSIMPDRVRKELFSRRFKQSLGGYSAIEVMRGHARQSPTDNPLSLVQYLDFKTYLPGDILTKVDRASMAHALEVRVPLLDHKFVEWVSQLPSALKLHNGEGKYIFKKSLESQLPNEILYRSKKGFSIPMASWLRGPLRQRVREAVLGTGLAETGIFNMTYLKQMVEQHESGRWDHSAPLWTLLMFDAFLRNVGFAPALQANLTAVHFE